MLRSLLLAALAGATLALAAAPAAQRAPLVLSASVGDDGAQATLVRGWAAVVTAVACARPGAGPVALAPAAGEWPASVRVVAAEGGGTWPAALVRHPDGDEDLDAAAGRACSGGWAWTLAPEATAALAPGSYTLAVEVDVAGGGAPLRSADIAVVVTPPPAAPTPDEQTARDLALADHARLHGRTAEARALVEAVVAAQPGHVGARLRQAEALAADGQTARALLAIEAAIAALPDALWDGPEPPTGLLDARAAHARAAAEATAFAVTAEPKAPAHPHAGVGATWTFALDGVQARALTLRRGTTYTFRLAGVPPDASFQLATDAAGTTAWTGGVAGAPAAGDGVVTFTPGADAPALLYYGSPGAPHAGWRLHVEDAPGATPSAPPAPAPALALSMPVPNPASGTARLELTAPAGALVAVDVLDVLGRRVATLHDGPVTPGASATLTLDVSRLAPGVYMVRALSERTATAQRLTVAR